MDAGSTLYQKLAGTTAVTDLVGTNIYPNQIPEVSDPYPAVVYSQLSQNFLTTKDGPIADGYQFRLQGFSSDFDNLQNIAEACRAALDWQEAEFQSKGRFRIVHTNQTDFDFIEDTEFYHVAQDYVLRKA